MPQLQRKISLFGLTMIAVGSCIGAGIFVTPGGIAQEIPHAGFFLIVWLLGGLVALTGALTFAELGGMFPKAGGVYVFLREAYGERTAFLYGWSTLLIVNTGSMAALALAFAHYLSILLPLTANQQLLAAIGLLVVLTFINIRGVEHSQRLTSGFTVVKLLCIGGIIFFAFLFAAPDRGSQVWSLTAHDLPNVASALLAGLVGVLWAFGGWHHASYLAGESIHPQRTVPRAMLLGAGIVTGTYILVNFAYLLLLSPNELAASSRVAADAVATIWPAGGQWVALIISISIAGTIAIYTMSAPRIYFAMASDGNFFSALAKLHPTFRTPANAMILQAVWAALLILFWGTIESLYAYVTFIDIAFMCLGGLSLFLFRQRIPAASRPYRVWGFPVVPAIFIGITAAFVLNTVFVKPLEALVGLAVVAVGLGCFQFFRN
ncbi:MAG: amino acid permease [Bacteroidota bacterium]